MIIAILTVLGVLTAITFAIFFSGIETAAYSVNTINLQASANEGNKNAQRILKMLKNMPRLITTMLIGTNLSIFIATNVLTNYLELNDIHNSELITTLILTPFCFIFAESLPKRIAFERPNSSMLLSAKLIIFFEYIFYPIAFILSGFGNLLQYFLDKKNNRANELRGRVRLYENLEAKTAEGKLSLDQYQMASRVMEHEDSIVADLMLNPLETFTVDENLSARQAGAEIRKNGYARALLQNKFSRFTGKIITINAIMNNEDMLEQPVMEIAENALLLERTTPVLQAISRLREAGARIAIITSRNGHFIGSVHFNTLVNSIVHGLNKDE